ncbi:MAG: GNAT family N-acetyltransferase [Myxococcota bacterium]
MMKIIEAKSDDPRIEALIALQQDHARQHTPTGSGHALEVGSGDVKQVRYFLAIEDGDAVGCVGLKPLSSQSAEIKTMHVIESRRGEGVAQALLEALSAAAANDGVTTLLLETGSSEGFEAARRFYARHGFAPCSRFGPYRDDDFSFCMKRRL